MRPNYLNLPYKASELRTTDRITASGRKIVEPDVDWFTHEAAGYTLNEYRLKREREAKRWRAVKQGLIVLGLVLLAVWLVVL